MSVVAVTFATNDLQTTTRLSGVVVHEGLPDKKISTQKIARRDGSIITGIEYTGKVIVVSGTMVQATQALLDADIDDLKADLLGQEGNLDIGYNAGTRRYVATCRDIKIERKINVARYEIEFYCVDPFGRATSATNHSFDGKTTSPYSDTATNAGTYEALPVWKVAFAAASSVTGCTIANTTTGESITVTVALAATDYIEVDTANMTVKKNTTPIDYTGVFPRLAVGSNSISITTPGTSRTINIDIDYTQRFL